MHRMIRLPFVATMLVGTALSAQESTATFLGTIRTSQGETAPGVRVHIEGQGLLAPRTLITDNRGEFRFLLLPPGNYTVTISKEGFVGSKATVRIVAGQTLRHDMRIRSVNAVVAEVEIVSSENVQVDKSDTKTATTVPVETLSELPVSLTSQAAMFLAPGVSGSSDYPAYRGGPGGGSQFTVNGISVRDNFLRYGRQTGFVIEDLTEGVQVVQSPLNARYGNTSGGITNITTKSGGNEFSGSIRVDIDRPDWDNMRNRAPVYYRYNPTTSSALTIPYSDNTPYMAINVNTVGVDDLYRRYQFTLLGPIIKNHLTFSYGRTWSPITDVSYTLTNVFSTGTNARGYYTPYLQGATSATNAPREGYRWGMTSSSQSRAFTAPGSEDITDQFKLYWLISSSHQLELYYTQNNLDSNDMQFGNLDPVESQYQRQISKRTLHGINYTGIIANGVLDVKYGRTRKEILWPSGPDDPIYIKSWSTSALSIENNFNDTGTFTQYLTNGNPGTPNPEIRQNENYSVNYYWSNGEHSIDVGFERLKETGLVDPSDGVNGRLFYVPGMSADGNYAVYNFFTSPFAAPTYNTTNAARFFGITYTNRMVPEYRQNVTAGGTGDAYTYDTTDAIYVNDLWMLNSNWSVMAGLRFDKWKTETRYGAEIDSSDISPRLEVKYDIKGDNRQLLSLSYAHLRGTLGFGNLGTYGRRPGNMVIQSFWNNAPEGTPANEMHLVSKQNILNTGNYTEYRRYDVDFGRNINPDLKPEVAKQVELSYRRAFTTGGFFRASVVHRKYEDNLYRRGVNNAITDPNDPSGAITTIENWLDFDPYNNRSYFGIELEWNAPVYRSATSTVEVSGAWTSSRSKGRVTWGDENATTAIRFDDLYASAGYEIDRYNAYGEYAASNHNRFNMNVVWRYGLPDQIRSTVGILGRYVSGAPSSLSHTQYLPGVTAGDTRPLLLQSTKDTPTTVAWFYGNRGMFIGPDYYYVDLKWTLNFPIYNRVSFLKRASFFTELTIGNIFNDVLESGYYRAASGTVRGSGAVGHDYDHTFRVNASIGDYAIFGKPSSWTVFRTYGFSSGIRF